MKHYDLEVEKLEERIAPGGFGYAPKGGGGGSHKSKSKSKSKGKSKGKCK